MSARWGALRLARTTSPMLLMCRLMQGIYAQNGPPTVLAGALVASLPTVALFLFLRRYMIKGLTLTVGAD